MDEAQIKEFRRRSYSQALAECKQKNQELEQLGMDFRYRPVDYGGIWLPGKSED